MNGCKLVSRKTIVLAVVVVVQLVVGNISLSILPFVNQSHQALADTSSLVAYIEGRTDPSEEWFHWGTLGTSMSQLALELRGTESQNRSTATIVRYEWDFGDGNTAQGEYVTHTYTTGNYDITLTVHDEHGNSASETLKIEVRGSIPTSLHVHLLAVMASRFDSVGDLDGALIATSTSSEHRQWLHTAMASYGLSFQTVYLPSSERVIALRIGTVEAILVTGHPSSYLQEPIASGEIRLLTWNTQAVQAVTAAYPETTMVAELPANTYAGQTRSMFGYSPVRKYHVNAHSAHFTDGYYIELMVDDPEQTIQSVSVTGPGIDGSLPLVSGIRPNQWWSRPNVNLGTTPPSLPLVYTFTITDKTGATYMETDAVLSYVEGIATNLSPANNEIVTGELVFSWTGIDMPQVRYNIELYDGERRRIWESPLITNTSYVYDGPILSPDTYQYYVCSWSEYGDESLAYETFRIGELAAHIEVDKTSIKSGERITFNGSGSSGQIVSYEWNFDDGTIVKGSGKPGVETHRFRGVPDGLKTYHVTLMVEDDSGATDTDAKHVLVEPLEKPVPWSGLAASANMTVRYNWVDETNGEDVYIISKIHTKSIGIVGIHQVSITRDTNQIWSDVLITPGYIVVPYVFPFEPTNEKFGVKPPIVTRVFSEGTYEGIEVSASDRMNLLVFGANPVTALDGGEASTAFDPDAPIEYPLEPYKYMPIGEALMAVFESAGELRVYDSDGRITGLVNGEVKEEIPDSAYFDGTVVILSPPDSYHYEVAGTEDGPYGLTLVLVGEGEATTFTSTDIPTVSGAVHQYTVDWNALSQGEEGVTVQIDSDGDGVFERIITADDELTGDEFILQTATTIDFDPHTLNLRSKGKFVTVYIELPPGYDVAEIDVSSVMLNATVPALDKPTQVGDYDSDGIPDLMLKFDRGAVRNILAAGDQVEITISGEVAGIVFEGSDTIRVIQK